MIEKEKKKHSQIMNSAHINLQITTLGIRNHIKIWVWGPFCYQKAERFWENYVMSLGQSILLCKVRAFDSIVQMSSTSIILVSLLSNFPVFSTCNHQPGITCYLKFNTFHSNILFVTAPPFKNSTEKKIGFPDFAQLKVTDEVTICMEIEGLSLQSPREWMDDVGICYGDKALLLLKNWHK